MVTQQLYSRSFGTINDQSPHKLDNGLIAQGLNKQVGGKLILNSVDITVEPGKITALIGPSGAGKTSLLKALSLLEDLNSGFLSIDGNEYQFPLNKRKFHSPWPHVTVVFQQLFMWPHLTLMQNITLPLGSNLDQKARTHLEELIERFNMGEFINRYPNRVSLGQRQRAALVRALVLRPKYLLLDEITSSLDVEQVGAILIELKKMKENAIGILLVTHLLEFARHAANSIVFMEGGKIIEAGGIELLSEPKQPRVRDFIAMAKLAS